MSIADDAAAEIESLHAFFEDWFAGAPDPEAGLASVRTRLAPDFEMVTPRGEVLGRESLLDSLAGSHGTYDRPDAFAIDVEDLAVRVDDEDRALLTYVEYQRSPDGETARRSSAWFRADADAPEGVAWVHLHETWTPDGAPE